MCSIKSLFSHILQHIRILHVPFLKPGGSSADAETLTPRHLPLSICKIPALTLGKASGKPWLRCLKGTFHFSATGVIGSRQHEDEERK